MSNLPPGFWVAMFLLGGGSIWSILHVRNGIGLPSLAVLGTVTVWYVGDAFYNDYVNYHMNTFKPEILESAWWQVACFLAVFLFAMPLMHRNLNGIYAGKNSGVLQMFAQGVDEARFQSQLTRLFDGCFALWLLICLIAALRLREQIPYYFFPFLGYKADAWGRARIGSGFDALLSLIFYFQLLVTSIFGVVAALSTNRRVYPLALICCAFSWPYFIFDRTRNTMLAVIIPGIVCFALLRLRGSWIKKAGALYLCFMLVNAWMGFVIANRGELNIGTAFSERGFSLGENGKVHHEGLNMYEELCWINQLTELGLYSPNWGSRYFAEAVNMIPRALWHNKPLIGIDYAIARGQKSDNGLDAGVNATMSTGLIGQGVVNFGGVIGPAFAALLMSFWASLLARLDLNINELGYLPLYGSGLILTFNLGRDITLITLYPFVFGWLAVWWLKRSRAGRRLSRDIETSQHPAEAALEPNNQKPPFKFAFRHPDLSFTSRAKTGLPRLKTAWKISFRNTPQSKT